MGKKRILIIILCTAQSRSTLSPLDTFAQNIHTYMWANYQTFNGFHKTATKWYKQILCPSAPIYSYQGYAHCLFGQKKYAKVVQLMQQFPTQFTNDAALQKIFAQSLSLIGKTKEADALFISLNIQFAHHPDIALHAVESYLRAKEPVNALLTIDNLMNGTHQQAHNFIFYFIKAQIHLQMHDIKQAQVSITKSLELHPTFDKSWLFFALLAEQDERLEDAIKGYTLFLQISKKPHQGIQKRLFDLIMKQKMSTKKQTLSFLTRYSFIDILHTFLYPFRREEYFI